MTLTGAPEPKFPAEIKKQTQSDKHDNIEAKPLSFGEATTIESKEAEPEPPYSVFSKGEILFIVFCASLAALFSPISANIYYPALTILASDLNVSNTLINLTVTTYLIFQGLAPSFIGAISDARGRRPAYCICFVTYVAACIGLALQNNYAALLVLRCLQGSGSSGTIALANAMVADVATSAERGTYMGYAFMGALVGPAIGPVIGGLLIDFLGWRSVFWFLAIFGGVTLIMLLAFLPETCRKVVGNGSIPPARWNYSILGYMNLRRQRKAGIIPQGKGALKKTPINPLKSLQIIVDRECGVLLLFCGILFGGFYMVATGLPSQLQKAYNFNTLQVGLCYLPFGCGSMTAAITIGRFLNWNFKRHAKKLGMEITNNKQQDITNFPIEAARLEAVFILVFSACAFVIAYGWTLDKAVNLSAPLIFLFFTAYSLSACFQALNTLVVDLNRDSPGSASAASNLVRCWIGAAAVAIVDPLLKAIGVGWVCTLVAGVWLLMAPVVLLVMKRGPEWRRVKREREEQKELSRGRDLEAADGEVVGESSGENTIEKR